MTNLRFLEDREFWLAVVRILRGNPWHIAATALVLGGVVSITGVAQYLIPPIAAVFGITINIPDTPSWISLLLIFIGVGMFITGRWLPERLPISPPNPHDVELLAQYRQLITLPLLQFLRDVSFRNRHRRSFLTPIEELVDQWNGAHFEFHDGAVQAALQRVIASGRTLTDLTNQYTFVDYQNPELGTSLTDHDVQHGISAATRLHITQMNQSARSLLRELNDFERLAQRRIPNL